jgi:HEAT repeat protein
LAEASEKLTTTTDLRLALALPEWEDTRTYAPQLRAVDQEARANIGKRLADLVKGVVESGDSQNQMALADLIGEIGTGIRGLPLDDKSGYARTLAPSLMVLMQKDDPRVRQAAARALPKIFPDPAPSAAALAQMLQSRDVNDRRAASEALTDMVRTFLQVWKKNRAQSGVEATDEDLIHCADKVVPVTAQCLTDSDPVVRRNGLNAIVQSVTALNDLIPGTSYGGKLAQMRMPPSGRRWAPDEKRTVMEALDLVNTKEALFTPLLTALKNESGLVAKSLTDSDVQSRVLSRQALELMGMARGRLLAARDVIPYETEDELKPKRDDLLKEAIEPGLLELAKHVRDSRIEVRRATLDFLETMDDAAAPAIPALLMALQDQDRFIRWQAVRTLGKVGRIQTDKTVPAIAKLVNPKEDPDVREAAATTLRSYGSAAEAALPQLIRMLNVGEAEVQESVIKAITGIGGPKVKAAMPALIISLDSRSPNVRRLAAEALGRMGSQARDALPALNAHARMEEDNTVRMAISEAILDITR